MFSCLTNSAPIFVLSFREARFLELFVTTNSGSFRLKISNLARLLKLLSLVLDVDNQFYKKPLPGNNDNILKPPIMEDFYWHLLRVVQPDMLFSTFPQKDFLSGGYNKRWFDQRYRHKNTNCTKSNMLVLTRNPNILDRTKREGVECHGLGADNPDYNQLTYLIRSKYGLQRLECKTSINLSR